MLTDPIVALATPPGRSAIALIRLSGKGAFDVAARALHPFHPDPPRTVRRVQVVHPATGAPVDDALAACFRGPRSYTGEDLVELSTHGGLLVPAAAVAALVAAGARPARPGEFTRRAVLNGKLDLLQAEATADLIDADSPAQARRAPQRRQVLALQRAARHRAGHRDGGPRHHTRCGRGARGARGFPVSTRGHRGAAGLGRPDRAAGHRGEPKVSRGGGSGAVLRGQSGKGKGETGKGRAR